MKKLVEAFGHYKVTKEQIEKRIQRRLDTITPAQLVALRKIYNSLKDGMSGPMDWFDAVLTEEQTPPDASSALKSKIKGKQTAQAHDVLDPAEMASGPCPDNPETTYTKAYCQNCKKFVGCPVWGNRC